MRSSLCRDILQAMQKNPKILLGMTLAAVLLFGSSIVLVFDIFFRVPDFTVLRTAVKVPIRLASGEESFRLIGPQAFGWVSLHSISKFLPRAIIASEDTSFYSHNGIDVHEIKEALKRDWEEKRFVRGASTLTQQLLKNVFLGRQKTLWRKAKEILWARDLEKVLSKGEIIQFYMNMAEWGPGIYGVREAAQHYFSESPLDLTARQSAFLAMLLPSPRRYHAYFKRRQLTQWAANRVNRILEIMLRISFIDEAIYDQAIAEQLWGVPVLPDTAPGVPIDPGNVTDLPNEDFETTNPDFNSPAGDEQPMARETQAPEPSSTDPAGVPTEGLPSAVTAEPTEPTKTEQ